MIEARDVFARVGFKGSPGNWVGVSGTPTANNWSLCAYNTRASTATSRSGGMIYDPTQGGMQVGTSDCTAFQRITWY